jgi:hypothetical protein
MYISPLSTRTSPQFTSLHFKIKSLHINEVSSHHIPTPHITLLFINDPWYSPSFMAYVRSYLMEGSYIQQRRMEAITPAESSWLMMHSNPVRENRPLTSSCLSLRLCPWNNGAPNGAPNGDPCGRIFIKFYIIEFYFINVCLESFSFV